MAESHHQAKPMAETPPTAETKEPPRLLFVAVETQLIIFPFSKTQAPLSFNTWGLYYHHQIRSNTGGYVMFIKILKMGLSITAIDHSATMLSSLSYTSLKIQVSVLDFYHSTTPIKALTWFHLSTHNNHSVDTTYNTVHHMVFSFTL